MHLMFGLVDGTFPIWFLGVTHRLTDVLPDAGVGSCYL
jgi:hypothetical protein